jgi:Flp pilus assembly protein TadD
MTTDPNQAIPPEISADLRTALALHRDGKLDDAVRIYQSALRSAPGNAVVLLSLGAALLGLGRTRDAVTPLEAALAARPDHPDTCFTLAEAYRGEGRIEEAYVAAKTGLEGNPDYLQGRVAMADALLDMGCHDDARVAFEGILDSNPNDMTALGKLGAFHYHAGEFDAAESTLSMAVAELPDDVETRWHLAALYLSQRRWSEGWGLYRWRWPMSKTVAQDTMISLPKWTGENLSGQRIMIWGEQGLGDELMFVTCLPDLLEMANPDLCVLACDQRLAAIFGRSFPNVRILPLDRQAGAGGTIQMPACDVQIAAGDLPAILRLNDDDFPSVCRRLLPDPIHGARWRERLDDLGSGLKVGIAWRGGTLERFRRTKSSKLSDWAQILATPGVRFVNLQYGDCAEELAASADDGFPVHHFDDLDPIADPERQMTLISELDLVIQTSNASAHMAGMLGVPVWNLVPYVADWRWGLVTEACLWYPSMRLFRQPGLGDWASVFEHVAEELRETAAKNN